MCGGGVKSMVQENVLVNSKEDKTHIMTKKERLQKEMMEK